METNKQKKKDADGQSQESSITAAANTTINEIITGIG